MERNRDILIIIGLFSVAFLIRVVGVSNVVLEWDEIEYWSKAMNILANNWVPTPEVFGGTSPFLPHIGAMVTSFFGGGLHTLRMISVLFGSLTVPLLYLFGKEMYGRKAGLLSALFLCFSAYHCFYSRILMIESFALFFVVAFLYFFWGWQCSEQDRKSTSYAIIAGVMMGLAISAKYLPVFLVPAVLIYVFWTSAFSFKALIDKRIILMLIFTLLIFYPLFICLCITDTNPIYHYTVELPEIYETASGGAKTRGMETPMHEIFIGGMKKIQEILAWGNTTLIPHWAVLYKSSVLLLFLITISSNLLGFINRERKSSFLMISIIVLGLLILCFLPAKYYLIYALPFYFVMLSHQVVKLVEDIKRENSYKNVFRISIILLTAIMLFSSVITASTSSYWDEGEHVWNKDAMDYIKNDIANSDYIEGVLIGLVGSEIFVDYYIQFYDFNATTCSVKTVRKYHKKVEIDLEKINKLKPNYIVVSEELFDGLFTNSIEKEILEQYRLVFHSKTYNTYNGFVFKRKNMQPPEIIPSDGKDGKISQDIFKGTLPGVMKVGNIYTVSVEVTNNGDSCADLAVGMHYDGRILFVAEKRRSITLDRGATRILKFKVVPIEEYAGKLPITVDLYVKSNKYEMVRKVDSCSDYIYLIKK